MQSYPTIEAPRVMEDETTSERTILVSKSHLKNEWPDCIFRQIHKTNDEGHSNMGQPLVTTCPLSIPAKIIYTGAVCSPLVCQVQLEKAAPFAAFQT
jgi:hypothetical protein